MIAVNDLRQNVFYKEGDRVFQVLEFKRHKVARQKGMVNVRVKDVETGATVEKTYKSSDSVDDVDVERRSVEFVFYNNRKGELVFSDKETKQRVQLPDNLIEENQRGFLVPNMEVFLLTDGDGPLNQVKIYSITIPNTIEVKVASAPPADKGDTASGGSKPVEISTGKTVNTPFFIKAGDIIKINTQTGEYMERISS